MSGTPTPMAGCRLFYKVTEEELKNGHFQENSAQLKMPVRTAFRQEDDSY